MTEVIKNEKQEKEDEQQVDISQEEAEELQRQFEMEQAAQQEESEEQIIENGRIALIQLETEGKKYFKPVDGVTYRLTFDRAAAVNVRGQPSEKLTREIKDKKSGEVIKEVPVLEWVYEITHISGNVQTWSITSKKLAAKILNELIHGKSILDVRKRKTGPQNTDVEYDVLGVS